MITKISKGKIILEDRVLENSNVYIEDGVIMDITEDELEFDKEINAEGYYVSPGFIDLHLHGAADGDFSNASVEENIAAVNYHCKHGTTSLFPTTLSASVEGLMASLDAIKKTKEMEEVLPNICGVHLEGPYFSQNQCGAQNKDFITPPVKEDYIKGLICFWDIIFHNEYRYVLLSTSNCKNEHFSFFNGNKVSLSGSSLPIHGSILDGTGNINRSISENFKVSSLTFPNPHYTRL